MLTLSSRVLSERKWKRIGKRKEMEKESKCSCYVLEIEERKRKVMIIMFLSGRKRKITW